MVIPGILPNVISSELINYNKMILTDYREFMIDIE